MMAKKRKHSQSPPGATRRGTAAIVENTMSGGHKWTIRINGRTTTSNTTASSVSMIADISTKYAPALKRLADE